MFVFSQSVTDVLKQLLQSLQLPFIFPAALLVLVTTLLFPVRFSEDPTTHAVIVGSLSVFVSYMLYACNVPIIRVAEGYSLSQTWVMRLSHQWEDRRFRKLRSDQTECVAAIGRIRLLISKLHLQGLLTLERKAELNDLILSWRARQTELQEQAQMRFPLIRQQPLPTALGNTIAAFEDYACHRYCIDSVHFWPRLLPLLEEKKFLHLVQGEKAIMDFLLNGVLVLIVLALEFILLYGLFEARTWYLAASLGILVAAYLLYQGAIVAALHWGGMVRVAFDLYRDDLRRALYLPPLPNGDLEAERKIWQNVSKFIIFGETKDFGGFEYPSPTEKKEERPY